jgi:hypothetical protein
VLIGNTDMRLKNWSLLYPDRRAPMLSPGYDFLATLPYIPNDTLALSFGGSRSLSEITPDQDAALCGHRADSGKSTVADGCRDSRAHCCRMEDH